MRKNLVLFFTIKEFTEVHLYKDVGLVPYYLCQEYDFNGKIVYSNEQKRNLPKNFRNLKLEEIKFIRIPKIVRKIDKFKILENINFYRYLLKNYKEIDILMFFHYRLDKFFLIILYKTLNPKGKVYIKMDSDGNFGKKCKLNYVKEKLYNFLKKNIDILSIETVKGYKILKENILCKNVELEYMPNGFDEEYIISNNIRIKEFKDKENIILTVGRLGTEQKNSELLLNAIENIDIKDWKILLIGPYTNEFKKEYEEFIKRNHKKKEQVLLVGNIKDKKELYEYYNKAKVFVLTSKWESFGIVLVEALRFGNYIITTDVGGARDVTKEGELGRIIEIGNLKQLEDEIEKVIENKINLVENYKKSVEVSIEVFSWIKLIKKLKL